MRKQIFKSDALERAVQLRVARRVGEFGGVADDAQKS